MESTSGFFFDSPVAANPSQAPKAGLSTAYPVLIREDFMGRLPDRLYPDEKGWFRDSGVVWDYLNY